MIKGLKTSRGGQVKWASWIDAVKIYRCFTGLFFSQTMHSNYLTKTRQLKLSVQIGDILLCLMEYREMFSFSSYEKVGVFGSRNNRPGFVFSTSG